MKKAQAKTNKQKGSFPALEVKGQEALMLTDAQIKRIIKSGGFWGRLFATGQNMLLFDEGRVVFPYKTVATVYKSVKAIADNFCQADFGIFADKKPVEDIPLTEKFEHPNSKQSHNDFLQEWCGFYALYGEAFIRKLRRTVGQAAGTQLPDLVNLNPMHMREILQGDELVGWKYKNMQFSLEEIIHTKDFNPYNPHRGMPPLMPIDQELEMDNSSMTFNKMFFRNDATPHFILSTDKNLTDEQRTRLQAWWDATHKGADKTFRTAIFEGGVKPSTLALTHKDMDFVEQKKMTREEIFGIWRVPKILFGISDNTTTFASAMTQLTMFWLYTITPISKKFEDSINEGFVKPYNQKLRYKFVFDNVPAFLEYLARKAEISKQLIKQGFTADEMNEKLNLGFKSEEWRKHWWIRFADQPADKILEDINNPSPDNNPINPATGEPGSGGAGSGSGTGQAGDVGAQGASAKPATRKSKKTQLQENILKGFSIKQTHVEQKLESKLRRYFMELRVEALHTPDHTLKEGKVTIEWKTWDAKLKKMIRPILLSGIQEGIEMGHSILSSGEGKTVDEVKQEFKSILDDLMNHAIQSTLELQVNKLVIINETLKKQVEARAKEVIGAQTEAGQSVEQIAFDVKEGVKDIFNMAMSRALTIARTESATAINGGSFLYYEKMGVQKKQWLTAHDEHVRESHIECEEEGALDWKDTFGNGCIRPNDPNGAPEEVINCRCTLQPIVE
jgi:HK97 family phage portal protein